MSCLADDLPTREAPSAATSKAPVTTLVATKVDGVHTDLVVTDYSDRLFIVVNKLLLCSFYLIHLSLIQVSQLGKLGTICEARREKAQTQQGGGIGDEGAGRPVYTVLCLLLFLFHQFTLKVSTLLGKESEEVELVARLLAEKLALGKPIVVCVAVKGITFNLAKQLADIVIERVQGSFS